jgi:hypothetical protein
MPRLERLKREVSNLTPQELAEFRGWFATFDAAAWDEQLEADAKAGMLDALANAALDDHRAGRSTLI